MGVPAALLDATKQDKDKKGSLLRRQSAAVLKTDDIKETDPVARAKMEKAEEIR